MHITFQIIIAALSVLGLYLCLKTLASLIFTSRQISASVIIETKEQLKDIDLLLPEASSAVFFARRRISVIIFENVWASCDEKEKSDAKEIIGLFGVKLYFVSAIDS